MGFTTSLVHVWNSLVEQAGFSLDDVPKEWDAFWSFWCDQVQPAVRRATEREEVWGVGLSMGVASDTENAFFQFLVPRAVFAEILRRIERLRPRPPPFSA